MIVNRGLRETLHPRLNSFVRYAAEERGQRAKFDDQAPVQEENDETSHWCYFADTDLDHRCRCADERRSGAEVTRQTNDRRADGFRRCSSRQDIYVGLYRDLTGRRVRSA